MLAPKLPLRAATPKDVDALAQLQRRAYEKYVERINAEPQPMAADFAAIIADDDVWLLEGDLGVVAALVLRRMPDHLLIWSVAVDPRLQWRGLGGQLLSFAEAQARTNGFEEIRLYTNEAFTENIALYEHIGYVTTHTEELDGRTIVHMRKALPA